MSQQQQQQKQPSPYRTYQPQPQFQPQPNRYDQLPRSNVTSAASGAFVSNFKPPRCRPSDLSEVPTDELHNWLKDPQLVQRKHDSIAGKLLTDPDTRQMMLNQCAIQTPHLLTELRDYLSSIGAPADASPLPIRQDNTELSQSEVKIVNEIMADQKHLEFASQQYREAREAFHLWETEIYQINAQIKARAALTEASRKGKPSSQ
ncbi:hypothetical protein FVEG_17717 [Fusarium verticillioides 7600]|uniref:Uncharacterized protein n=1 Tax=Gibberella moniliformis (strain M3125 / FGSC 7600) TaxID=334819 RepID=W7NHR3_GIBM7|nr:hypothetical protein FVEG_17717 [Fusarium verticillioides 7600]EWG55962.1 hypothetical protein FVEG_17717 [Fusarium verticillioides 7600]